MQGRMEDVSRADVAAVRGALLLGLAAACAIGLTACGGEEPAAAPPPQDAVVQPDPEPESEPEPVEEPTEAGEDPAATGEAEPVDDPAETGEGPTATGEAELLWRAELEDPVVAVATHPDGVHLAVGARATFLYQLADGRMVGALVRRHTPEDLAYAPDGATLAIGLGVYGVSMTEVDSGEEFREVGGGFNSRVSFAPDGAHLATGDRSGSVTLWTPDGSEELAELVAHDLPSGPMDASVTALEHHPDGVLLAATQWEDCITRIWDTRTEEIVHTLDLGANCPLVPTPFAFAPDGATMVGPDEQDGDPVLRWWAADTAEPVDHVPYGDELVDLAFSPDSSLLAVAGRPGASVDGQVHVFDTGTGELFALLEPEPLEDDDFVRLNSIAFSPDGGHVVVGRWDGVVEVWRLPGAEELVAPEPDPCEPLPIPSDVLFDTGSAELKADADAVLTELADGLAARFPEAELTFVGHTDSRGDASSNQQLSVARGTAVATWFEAWAEANDLDGFPVAVEGRGDTELAVQDVDDDGVFLESAGELNRRVEIIIEAEECAP